MRGRQVIFEKILRCLNLRCVVIIDIIHQVGDRLIIQKHQWKEWLGVMRTTVNKVSHTKFSLLEN